MRRNVIVIIIWMILFNIIPGPVASAQSKIDYKANKAKLDAFLADTTAKDQPAQVKRVSDYNTEVVPEAPVAGSADLATLKAYQESLQKYYAYRIFGFDHRQKVFEWQHLSTKIIFIVVLILVLSGIYFAAVQFHSGLRHPRRKPASEETTELVFSWKSIEVKSPVLGVIILVISLVFFYLYLVYVYPIVNVF
jgi:hypothetical protein